MSEWISVKDRLPEPKTDILAYHSSGSIKQEIALFGDKPFLYEGLYGPVTHWMPLPEPPKEV